MDFYDSSDTNVSKHNEATMKMNRINQLQVEINFMNKNLLGFNQEVGILNYHLHLASNYSLMMEVYPKLKDEEQNKVMTFYEAIYQYLTQNPVYRTKHTRDGSSITNRKPDMVIFDNVRKRLIRFETLVQWLLDKHNLGSEGDARDKI